MAASARLWGMEYVQIWAELVAVILGGMWLSIVSVVVLLALAQILSLVLAAPFWVWEQWVKRRATTIG